MSCEQRCPQTTSEDAMSTQHFPSFLLKVDPSSAVSLVRRPIGHQLRHFAQEQTSFWNRMKRRVMSNIHWNFTKIELIKDTHTHTHTDHLTERRRIHFSSSKFSSVSFQISRNVGKRRLKQFDNDDNYFLGEKNRLKNNCRRLWERSKSISATFLPMTWLVDRLHQDQHRTKPVEQTVQPNNIFHQVEN